jgi:hypothetical protein
VNDQLVARTVAELRAMPEAEDLLARLGRVVEATRTVVGVDGTGLTLTCEDGQPRWVAATDAAMQLLEEVQHDVGEGRVLPPSPRTGWWPSRTCAAIWSGTESRWWSGSCRCGGC